MIDKNFKKLSWLDYELIMSPQLCLGTVQFGMDYGLTNAFGKVNTSSVKEIVQTAFSGGIKFLDTAQIYGEAEEVLGNVITRHQKFKIINKFVSNTSNVWSSKDIKNWEKRFQESLQKLKVNKIDSFLVHHHKDLIREDAEFLLSWMESLKERSLINRIGVSIYEVSDLDLLPLDRLELVQLPLSIYDQSFLNSGTIDYLVSAGISVHIRSIFLQGLLLNKSENWPNFLSKEFLEHHSCFCRELKKLNLNPLDAVMDFTNRCSGIEAALIGVTNQSELSAILSRFNYYSNHSQNIVPICYPSWAWTKNNDVDPRTWPSL